MFASEGDRPPRKHHQASCCRLVHASLAVHSADTHNVLSTSKVTASALRSSWMISGDASSLTPAASALAAGMHARGSKRISATARCKHASRTCNASCQRTQGCRAGSHHQASAWSKQGLQPLSCCRCRLPLPTAAAKAAYVLN